MNDTFLLLSSHYLLQMADSIRRAAVQSGIPLTPSQVLALAEARSKALTDTGRVELGGGTLEKLIQAFGDSPFFEPDQAVPTLDTLMMIFYELKNETFDTIPDDDLISFLREQFDGRCKGSLEMLADVSLGDLGRRVHGALEEEPASTTEEDDPDA